MKPPVTHRHPPRFLPAMATLFALGLGVGVASLCTGCVHHVGDACYEGDAFCQDKSTCLTCQGGKLVAYSCTGAKGCSRDKVRSITCDQSSGVAVGQACFPDYEGKGQCRLDGSGFLTCTQGTWTLTPCPSGSTCKDVNGQTACVK